MYRYIYVFPGTFKSDCGNPGMCGFTMGNYNSLNALLSLHKLMYDTCVYFVLCVCVQCVFVWSNLKERKFLYWNERGRLHLQLNRAEYNLGLCVYTCIRSWGWHAHMMHLRNATRHLQEDITLYICLVTSRRLLVCVCVFCCCNIYYIQ